MKLSPMKLIALFLISMTSTVCLGANPRVELIAHRGASHDAPENTVAAFKLAWEQHADGAECDLYLTSDQKIIASHDKTTKRTAGIEKLIAKTAFDELRALDVGSWKAAAFQGEKMPTLKELLDAVPAGKKIYLEVKCGPEIVPMMLRELKASGKKPEETPVICFNADVIAAVKQQRPDLPAYFLHNPEKITAEAIIAQARQIQADGVDLKNCPQLDRAYVEKIHDAGLRLDVWTVDDVAEANRLIQLGVQGITTNRPGFLREQIPALQ